MFYSNIYDFIEFPRKKNIYGNLQMEYYFWSKLDISCIQL